MTLVGFSLGARVVFKCLQALAETEKNGMSPSHISFFRKSVIIRIESLHSWQLKLWKELFFLEHQFQSRARTGET